MIATVCFLARDYCFISCYFAIIIKCPCRYYSEPTYFLLELSVDVDYTVSSEFCAVKKNLTNTKEDLPAVDWDEYENSISQARQPSVRLFLLLSLLLILLLLLLVMFLFTLHLGWLF